MFYGQKEQVIDEKNRMVLPSLYRSQYQDGVVYVTLGMDECLEVFSSEEYSRKSKAFESLNPYDPKARMTKRTFFGNSYRLTIDSHSRILLPRQLMDKVGLGRKAVIVGMSEYLEIWDYDKFKNVEEEEERNYSTNAESLVR